MEEFNVGSMVSGSEAMVTVNVLPPDLLPDPPDLLSPPQPANKLADNVSIKPRESNFLAFFMKKASFFYIYSKCCNELF